MDSLSPARGRVRDAVILETVSPNRSVSTRAERPEFIKCRLWPVRR